MCLLNTPHPFVHFPRGFAFFVVAFVLLCTQLLIDLVNHSSSVLPFESRKEIRLLTPSRDGRLLLVLDVDGRALLVNLQRRVVLHRFNFKKKVRILLFSTTSRSTVVVSRMGSFSVGVLIFSNIIHDLVAQERTCAETCPGKCCFWCSLGIKQTSSFLSRTRVQHWQHVVCGATDLLVIDRSVAHLCLDPLFLRFLFPRKRFTRDKEQSKLFQSDPQALPRQALPPSFIAPPATLRIPPLLLACVFSDPCHQLQSGRPFHRRRCRQEGGGVADPGEAAPDRSAVAASRVRRPAG